MRRMILPLIALSSALLAAGCGGNESESNASESGGADATLKAAFLGCLWDGGYQLTDKNEAVDKAHEVLLDSSEFATNDDIISPSSVDDYFYSDEREALLNSINESTSEVHKLAWDSGYSGSFIETADTDQPLFVALPKAADVQPARDAVAGMFEPLFDGESTSGMDWAKFDAERITTAGDNAIIVDLSDEGFTEATQRLVEGCASGEGGE